MKVAFIWPDCDYLNGQWHAAKPVDCYVVGGPPEEIITKIVPYLTLDKNFDLEKAKKNAADPDGNLWFQVAKDLSSVVAIHWYYPVSHMWNGYSPFQAFYTADQKMVQLDTLENIKHLKKSGIE